LWIEAMIAAAVGCPCISKSRILNLGQIFVFLGVFVSWR
jgi:hypothetical protein